jgi:phosphate transport system protein
LKEAKRIYDEDNIINEKRYALENAIIILLATQQPFARDLRLLAAMLLVVNELERMADYAKGSPRSISRLASRYSHPGQGFSADG